MYAPALTFVLNGNSSFRLSAFFESRFIFDVPFLQSASAKLPADVLAQPGPVVANLPALVGPVLTVLLVTGADLETGFDLECLFLFHDLSP